jgi:hypothetical protein
MGQSLGQLATRSEALRLELEQCQRAIAAQEQLLCAAGKARGRAEDLLGQDVQGRPLRLLPLIWALVGGLGALTATFCTYLVAIMSRGRYGPDSDIMTALLATTIALSLAGISLFWSGRQGAGGLCRAVLRPLTLILGGGSVIALIVVGLFITQWMLLR